jgi:Flp pilus assembly protein TadG
MAPLFLALTVGVVEVGLLMWIQLGLQHGVEMAARCATINTTLCNSTSDIQNFAAQNAYGLNPPGSAFTVSSPPASPCGNQVTASYNFNWVTDYFFASPSLTLSARSCYPK